MKIKWIHEVKRIVEELSFQVWLEELGEAQVSRRDAIDRYQELLAQVNLLEFKSELTQKNAIDTLYSAGEYEDDAALLLAESTELDNRSLEMVGGFEDQRLKTSEIWFRIQALELEFEKAILGGTESKAKDLEKQIASLRKEYEGEQSKKGELWTEVERVWETCLEKNLYQCEKKARGRQERSRAERLFAEAEALKNEAEVVKEQCEVVARERERCEEQLAVLLDRARTAFGGYIHEDFIYWAQREDNKSVYVVPLRARLSGYNIDLKPGALYQCDRSRGVEFLEPVIDAPAQKSEDPRLEEFFTIGRPSEPRTQTPAGDD